MTDKFWPKTQTELNDFIVEQQKLCTSYDSTPEAVAQVAVAAFNYMCHASGMTGFQAGWAEMRFIQLSKGWERFSIINYNDALYPQYDLKNRFDESLENAKPWLREQAQKLLDEYAEETAKNPDRYPAHPEVLAHWKKLASD